MIEVLRCFGNLGLGLHRILEGANCCFVVDCERKEVIFIVCRCGDIQSDTPRIDR